MNNRQLAQVGLGLLGVWALLSAVEAFIQIGAVVGASLARLGLAEIIPVALLLGLSYLLIFHNSKVASAIFPDVTGAADDVAPDIARTLVALTGVLLLVQAMPGAFNAVFAFLPLGVIDPTLRARVLGRFIGILVTIACGIYLIVRPGQLLEYVQRPLAEQIADAE